jgi:hypothetical protein
VGDSDERLILRILNDRHDRLEKKVDDGFEKIGSLVGDLTLDHSVFKTKALVNAKWVAGILSSAIGLFSLALSVGLSVYLSREERRALIDAAHIAPDPVKGHSSP